MQSLVAKVKISALILVWTFLTSTAPFIFFRWPGHPYKTLTAICLVLMLLGLAFKKSFKAYDWTIFIILLIQISYYLVLFLLYTDFSTLNLVIQLISLFILINYIRCFIGYYLFAKSFILLMIAMAIGGTVIFFLHAIKGLEPIFYVSYGGDISFFLGLTTTNVFINTENIRILRYSGFFDEPGAFALFSTFALVINKVYFDNKRNEFLLIVFTFFTFSMAFYFTMIFYFLFFYLKRSTFIYFLIIFISIPITFMVFKKIDIDIYTKFTSMTIDRFIETQTDPSSSNRSDLMKHDYKAFIENPFFGTGPSSDSVAGSNVYAVIAKYGIVGSLFFYIFLVYILLLIFKIRNKEKTKFLKLFFIISLSFFHRPELSSVFTLSIFYMIIYFLRFHKDEYSKSYLNRELLVF
jgi:hypothetical protein